MSNDKLSALPNSLEDIDATNIRRVTLTRTGVAALFAQSSYDTGEKVLTTDSTRLNREYRPPPVTRSWLTSHSTTSNNTTGSSFRSTGPTVAAQRSSLFRYVIQRSSSFATTAVSQAVLNTRRHTLKQIRSICNQHDKVSSIDSDVIPVASITDCLEAPSIAAVQICRSISMPNTADKYRQHYKQQHLLVKSGGKPM
ncbi:unnamed protein product [Rotaria magnacalcarata]|uniref:Uncharacterized protein n=3 Tax=Rotaria magnacalcarata TaxID=392030 RepID=A0A814NWY3_9BILA|nr:unnamed protein product [Rotaria magnacalcarata]CAF1401429.1 unnamed protein product [Rotaria magnacalcarata]CAF1987468.1 unnamed protein product [Rotaria magnacalcarata]CAF3839096.1 unnamed protein product [Rotaria magnacalcarata]CAF4974827.1 unnamed protein product [Rotaria magnacalcarata]